MSSDVNTIDELLDLSQQLLDSIAQADWETYSALCDPTLTAFEGETLGALVEGMEFHRYYFDLSAPPDPQSQSPVTVQNSLCSPHVRLLGDTAIVCYVRLVQKLNADGKPITVRFEETRVWHRGPEGWKHVHFHRSADAAKS